MAVYLYILKSQKTGRFYCGITADLNDRMRRHNSGYMKSTKAGVPWTLLHTEHFEDRSLAIMREKEIKRWKSSKAIEDLLSK